MRNVSFINNNAGIEGGAIKWNLFEPSFGPNVIFKNNCASLYGDDIASVSKKLF